MHTRYDVEVFQNIEKHIKLKMEEFGHEQDAVMLLNDHVAEASRMAERKVQCFACVDVELHERISTQDDI